MAEETLIQEKPELLAFVSFKNDGTVVSHTAIPYELPLSKVKQVVKIFLASVSVSEALLGHFEESARDANPGVSQRTMHASNVSQVKFENDTNFLATPHPELGGRWYGILASAIILHDAKVLRALLPSLLEAANELGLGPCDLDHKLFSLWNNIWRLTKARFWSNEKPVLQVKKSLIALAEFQAYHDDSYTERRVLPKYATRQILRALERFRSCVSVISGEESCCCILISPHLLSVHIDEVPFQQSESVLWYYANVVKPSSRISGNYFVECLENGGMRLWYKWNEWVLCTQFVAEKIVTDQCFKNLRTNARLMLRVLSEVPELQRTTTVPK